LQRERNARTDAQARVEALNKKLGALQRKLQHSAGQKEVASALEEQAIQLQQAQQRIDADKGAALLQAQKAMKAAQAQAKASHKLAGERQAEAAASNAQVLTTRADLTNLRAEVGGLKCQLQQSTVALAEAERLQHEPPPTVKDDAKDLGLQLEQALQQRDAANVQLVTAKKSVALKNTELEALREDFGAFRASMAEFRAAATQAVGMHQDMAQAVARAAGAAKLAAAKEALVNMMRVCVVAPQITLKLVQSRTVNHFAGGSGEGMASDTHITEHMVSTKAPISAAMENLRATIYRDIMPRFALVYSKGMKAADAALSKSPYTLGSESSGGATQGSEGLFQAVSDAEEAKMLSDLCDRMATAVKQIIAAEFEGVTVNVNSSMAMGQVKG
jgi:myosin heavy subunit